MIFKTKERTDMVNILILIEALERGVKTEQVDIYDYLNFTDNELTLLFKQETSKLKTTV